jgi:hypothetical protein
MMTLSVHFEIHVIFLNYIIVDSVKTTFFLSSKRLNNVIHSVSFINLSFSLLNVITPSERMGKMFQSNEKGYSLEIHYGLLLEGDSHY